MEIGRRIIILGAGPAGLSAALWLRNLGFSPVVTDVAEHAGGLQNLNFLANDWVLGQTGLTGPALAERFVDHVRRLDVPILTGRQVRQVERGRGGFRVRLTDGEAAHEEIACLALIIATGTRYRANEILSGLPGFSRLDATQVAYGPYAFARLDTLSGKRVLVLGGGDNAFENARLLAANGAQVDLAIRSRARAQASLAAAVAVEVRAGRCRIHQMARAVEIGAAGDGLLVRLDVGGQPVDVMVDRIHVLAGYEPNTTFIADAFRPELAAALVRDDQGYLVVDNAGRTGEDGIYAAGDVCNPGFPSVVSALAQGAVVAKAVELDLRLHGKPS